MRKSINFGNEHFMFLHKGTQNDGVLVVDKNFGAQPPYNPRTMPITLSSADGEASHTMITPNSMYNVIEYAVDVAGIIMNARATITISRNGEQPVSVSAMKDRSFRGLIEVMPGDEIVLYVNSLSSTGAATVSCNFAYVAEPTTDYVLVEDDIQSITERITSGTKAIKIPVGYTKLEVIINGSGGGGGGGGGGAYDDKGAGGAGGAGSGAFGAAAAAGAAGGFNWSNAGPTGARGGAGGVATANVALTGKGATVTLSVAGGGGGGGGGVGGGKGYGGGAGGAASVTLVDAGITSILSSYGFGGDTAADGGKYYGGGGGGGGTAASVTRTGVFTGAVINRSGGAAGGAGGRAGDGGRGSGGSGGSGSTGSITIIMT